MATLDSIERKFFVKKTGKNEPTNVLKSIYFKTAGANGKYLPELETNWLRLSCASAGATIVPQYKSDLWKTLNSFSGLTVSQFVDENKRIYFLNNT